MKMVEDQPMEGHVGVAEQVNRQSAGGWACGLPTATRLVQWRRIVPRAKREMQQLSVEKYEIAE
jgi:hypothetical protein